MGALSARMISPAPGHLIIRGLSARLGRLFRPDDQPGSRSPIIRRARTYWTWPTRRSGSLSSTTARPTAPRNVPSATSPGRPTSAERIEGPALHPVSLAHRVRSQLTIREGMCGWDWWGTGSAGGTSTPRSSSRRRASSWPVWSPARRTGAPSWPPTSRACPPTTRWPTCSPPGSTPSRSPPRRTPAARWCCRRSPPACRRSPTSRSPRTRRAAGSSSPPRRRRASR